MNQRDSRTPLQYAEYSATAIGMWAETLDPTERSKRAQFVSEAKRVYIADPNAAERVKQDYMTRYHEDKFQYKWIIDNVVDHPPRAPVAIITANMTPAELQAAMLYKLEFGQKPPPLPSQAFMDQLAALKKKLNEEVAAKQTFKGKLDEAKYSEHVAAVCSLAETNILEFLLKIDFMGQELAEASKSCSYNRMTIWLKAEPPLVNYIARGRVFAPIHQAAWIQGETKMLDLLARECPQLVSSLLTQDNRTALDIAVSHGNSETAKKIRALMEQQMAEAKRNKRSVFEFQLWRTLYLNPCPTRFIGSLMGRQLQCKTSFVDNAYHAKGMLDTAVLQLKTPPNPPDFSRQILANAPPDLVDWVRTLQPTHRCKGWILSLVLDSGNLVSKDLLDRIKEAPYKTAMVMMLSQNYQLNQLLADEEFRRNSETIIDDLKLRIYKMLVSKPVSLAELGIAFDKTLNPTGFQSNQQLERAVYDNWSTVQSILENSTGLSDRDRDDDERDEIYLALNQRLQDIALSVATTLHKTKTAQAGIGCPVDRKLELHKSIFAILGANTQDFYGDFVLVLKRDVMFHPDFDVTLGAAHGFSVDERAGGALSGPGGPFMFQRRPWILAGVPAAESVPILPNIAPSSFKSKTFAGLAAGGKPVNTGQSVLLLGELDACSS